MRLEPHAIARLRRAPAARQRRDLGHQRQDDDRRDGRPAILERARRAPRPQPRRGEHGRRRRRPRCMAGPRDGDTGLFEVDEFWLGQVVDELQPRALLLANLFRDQLDRYGELDTIADRWAAVVARAPRPRSSSTPTTRTVADLGRDRVGAHVLRRRGRRDGAGRRCSTPPTPSTAGAAARPTATTPIYLGHLGRYHCDNCGATRPDPQVAARDIVLEGVRGARFTLRTPAGDARRSRCRCPGSTTSTTRSAPPRWRSRWARRSTTSSPACRRSPPRSGAPRRVRVGDRDLSILLVKNPAGANEVLRTLDARARRARRARRPQRPHRRRARRQLGVGRRLRGPRRRACGA